MSFLPQFSLFPEGVSLFERHPPHFSAAVYTMTGKTNLLNLTHTTHLRTTQLAF
jgi:hypothetical protein